MLGRAACLGQGCLWELSVGQRADEKDSVSVGESVVWQLREPRLLLPAFLCLTRGPLLLHGICITMLKLQLWTPGNASVYSLPLSVEHGRDLRLYFLRFCSNSGIAGVSGRHSHATQICRSMALNGRGWQRKSSSQEGGLPCDEGSREKRQMILLNRRPSRLPTRVVSTFPDTLSLRVFSLKGSEILRLSHMLPCNLSHSRRLGAYREG